jgi:hypothetical protein
LTITCYLATVMVNNKIGNDEQMHLRRGPFRRPCRCAGAIQTALPNATCPGLLRKPLDASIRQLLAPYCPSGRQGNRQTNNNQQMTLKRWPNQWPWQCAGTLPRTSPNGGGLGLSKTKRHHWASIAANNDNRSRMYRFFLMFSSSKPQKKVASQC